MSDYEEILRALAADQVSQFNQGPVSQFANAAATEASGKLGAAGQAIIQALMAPGNALRGEYNQVGIMGDGSVTMADPRMYDDATELAGLVGLGAMPMPRPADSLSMGLKMFHGSPDIRWLDEGQAFSAANPVTAPSKYMFASPKRQVAETYAGISDMARWRAENGMGPPASPYAGIRQIELLDGAKVLKVNDVKKLPPELGVEWGGVDSLERLLDAAKAQGYDAVQMVMDGGNYAILNPQAVKRITTPRPAR